MHAPIRDGLRKRGVFVLDLSRAGKGCPDLLCHTPRTGWVPIEVKSDRKVSHRKKGKPLTSDQEKLHTQVPIAVVDTFEAALQLFGLTWI